MWSARNSRSAVLLICGWITIKMMKDLISYIITWRLVGPGEKRGVWVILVLGRVQRQGDKSIVFKHCQTVKLRGDNLARDDTFKI